MKVSKSTGLALVGALVLVGAILAGQGRGTSQQEQEKELKRVPVEYSRPDSGAQMYKDYCAACHGMQGKGNGPAAEFFKTPPSDLTTMAQRNGGKFPAESVRQTLLLGTQKHPHGTSDMPVWGALFRSLHGNKASDPVIKLRLANLTSYIESLQSR